MTTSCSTRVLVTHLNVNCKPSTVAARRLGFVVVRYGGISQCLLASRRRDVQFPIRQQRDDDNIPLNIKPPER